MGRPGILAAAVGLTVLVGAAQAGAPGAKPRPSPPPVVSLVELSAFTPDGRAAVRVTHPSGWVGDYEADRRSIRLVGPGGEGEIFIGVAHHGDELGAYLQDLKRRHPGSVPSPPETIAVRGVRPEAGERATRFVITGREAGELVMIERAGLMVLFATLVTPESWPELKKQLDRCYPSVEVGPHRAASGKNQDPAGNRARASSRPP